MFSMMIIVCSTSEYRTIIYFDARSDPNVISVNMARKLRLMPVYVLSGITTGHQESAKMFVS